MAKHVIKNPTITVKPHASGSTAVDLSDHIRSVSFSRTAAEVDSTGFNADGHVTRLGGLKDGSVDFDWQQDFSSGSVYDTLKDELGEEVEITIQPNPEDTTIGADNPEFKFRVIVGNLPTIDGGVGELSTFSTTWSLADAPDDPRTS